MGPFPAKGAQRVVIRRDPLREGRGRVVVKGVGGEVDGQAVQRDGPGLKGSAVDLVPGMVPVYEVRRRKVGRIGRVPFPQPQRAQRKRTAKRTA